MGMDSVGGYRPGDGIGAGVVITPQEVGTFAAYKQVTVDLDQNYNSSPGDRAILVGLPKRLPAGLAVPWSGGARLAQVAGFGLFAAGTGTVAYPVATASGKLSTKGLVRMLTTQPKLAAAAGAAVVGLLAMGYAVSRHHGHDRRAAAASLIPDLIPPKQ